MASSYTLTITVNDHSQRHTIPAPKHCLSTAMVHLAWAVFGTDQKVGGSNPPAAPDESPGHHINDLSFSLSGTGVRVRVCPAVVGSWRVIVPNMCPSFAAQDLADPGITDSLQWTHGDREQGLISGHHSIGRGLTLLEIAHEITKADETAVRRGAQTDAEVDHYEYANVIAATLRWLVRAQALPPIETAPPVRLHPSVRLPDPSQWPDNFTEDVARRGRLDSEGHKAVAYALELSVDDWETLNRHPIMRDADELDAVRATVVSSRPQGAEDRYSAGVLASFMWAVGERRESPWTDATPVGDRPTWVELQERSAPLRRILREGPQPDMTRSTA